MRVLFSSTRGSGHVQPLLPYARALLARGHQVLIAAPAEVGETLRNAGLAHAPFDHPGAEALAPIWARLRGVSEAEAAAIAAREIFAGINARVALPKLQDTVRDFRPQLIVRDSVEYAALIASAVAGVPHARIAVHSVSFEEMLPALTEAPLAALGEQAGLTADQGVSLRDEPVFSSFPAALDVLPANSRQRAPFRARPVDDAASATSHAWAGDDDAHPLVYITFGTIAPTLPEIRPIYRSVLEAIAGLPVRAVLTTGQALDAETLGAMPPNVHVAVWIPQRYVLSRANAVLCHGGSGTLLGALAAGLPVVVVPFGADQPHNGQLVAAAGVGFSLQKPDAGELRVALQRVLGSAELHQNARRLAVEIAAMPTIDRAVDKLLEIA
jgi:UDP:flavonoid glycosyltransferase YjiC (YdhE family)